MKRGRANVIVYNWSHSQSASANLSSILNPEDAYEVRSVYDFYGAPVASGTSAGGSISIPLVNRPVPVPVAGWRGSAASTGTDFQVFIVVRPGS